MCSSQTPALHMPWDHSTLPLSRDNLGSHLQASGATQVLIKGNGNARQENTDVQEVGHEKRKGGGVDRIQHGRKNHSPFKQTATFCL